MSNITVRNLKPELVNRLNEIAAENGQDLETFIACSLTQIVNDQAANKETGLGSRMAARFAEIGLTDEEARRMSLPYEPVRNLLDEKP